MAIVASLLSPGRALAGVSGQIGDAWSPPSELAGKELLGVTMVAIDPSDGSVFLGSLNSEFNETVIRKFSDTGHLEASVTLPGRNYVGLAVDPDHERLYILAGERVEGIREATKILAYSTTPTGEQLVTATPEELPVHLGGEKLLNPYEIVVDPSTGDLVVLASFENGEEEKRFTTLQRIDVDPVTGVGTVGEKFVEEEDTEGRSEAGHRAIAIDEAGVTYLYAERVTLDPQAPTFTVESLSPEFSASSKLTPVPGFAAAVAARQLDSATEIVPPQQTSVLSLTHGPQVAVSTSATGEDTLYWKVEGENDENYQIEGYSVAEEARAVAFGGGTEEAECRISVATAALAGEEDGDLAVFDQGSAVNGPGEPVLLHPQSYQFGPGGSGCPAPAPGFKLESEGKVVSSVPAGSTVTFNGTETELNTAPALEGGTWEVEGGPCGFSEPITASALTFSRKFVMPGSYTVRMIVEASSPLFSANRYSAQPRTFTVTAGSDDTPNVGCIGPNEGSTAGGTEVMITGTNLSGATEVKFGETAVACTEVVTTCKVESDNEIKATTPILDPGVVDVHVVTAAGESPADASADQFKVVGPPPPTFTLTVSKSGSGTGTVTSSPAGIKCGVTCAASFNEKSSVTLTATPSAGSMFAGWGGACAGATGSCVVTMDAAKAVTATFEASKTPPNENPGQSNENQTPSNNNQTPSNGGQTTPGEIHPGGGSGPTKTHAEIVAAQRKAALKKCQKLKGKSKAMCVKRANQIGKPKPKKTKKPKK